MNGLPRISTRQHFFTYAILAVILCFAQISSAQTSYSIHISEPWKTHTEWGKSDITFNLGDINVRQRVGPIYVYLVNHSDTPLIVKKAYWAVFCGVEYSQKPAYKGDSVFLKYECYPNHPGPFDKTSQVVTNRGELFFKFRGTISKEDIKDEKVPQLIGPIDNN